MNSPKYERRSRGTNAFQKTFTQKANTFYRPNPFQGKQPNALEPAASTLHRFSHQDKKRLLILLKKLENFFVGREERQYHQAVDYILLLREFLKENTA